MTVAPISPAARAAAATQITQALNVRPLYDLLKRKIPETTLPSFNVPFSVADSSALLNVSLVSLKNVPYVFAGDQLNINDWSSFISSRIRYMETALFSVVSLVHNVVFATVFSALALVTLGQISKLNQLATKHLVQTGLAIGSFVVSVIGTIVPKWGIMTNLALGGAVGVVFLQHTENELAGTINDFYQKNKTELRGALLTSLGNNQPLFNEQIEPMLQFIERQLASDRVRPFGGLLQIFTDVYRNHAAAGVLAAGLGGQLLQDITGGATGAAEEPVRTLLGMVQGLLPTA